MKCRISNCNAISFSSLGVYGKAGHLNSLPFSSGLRRGALIFRGERGTVACKHVYVTQSMDACLKGSSSFCLHHFNKKNDFSTQFSTVPYDRLAIMPRTICAYRHTCATPSVPRDTRSWALGCHRENPICCHYRSCHEHCAFFFTQIWLHHLKHHFG